VVVIRAVHKQLAGCLIAGLANLTWTTVIFLFAVQPHPAAAQDFGKNLPPGSVYNEKIPKPSDEYPPSPEATLRPGVTPGKVYKFNITDSKIFPHTNRTISVYVPAAYTGEKPACLLVVMNGFGANWTTIFDNLIAQHAMPMTIGMAVSPGVVTSATPNNENPRFDRSFELDSMNERLALFIMREVIPAVEHYSLPGGVPINISENPDDHAIAGGSTGGIAAFTVAWEHPEAFRRVYTEIGTFVDMRHGEQYYVRVRKTEPKPIRIFMQDNASDEWPGGPEMGDWFMSNVTMNRALEFAGYDVAHIWGIGTHNDKMGAAVLPEAMRWLWRDWPKPIVAGTPGNPVLKDILQPGEDWHATKTGCNGVNWLAADLQGTLAYGPAPTEQIDPSASATTGCDNSAGTTSFVFGHDGQMYSARAAGGIVVRDSSGSTKTVAEKLGIASFTVRGNGDIYALTVPRSGENALWFIPANGEPKQMNGHMHQGSGVAVTPDGLWLFVSQHNSHSGISYRVLKDGQLDAGEPFYDFEVPQWADDPGAGQVAMDRDGRAYVATRLGVQVFDRNGRVTAILPLPGNQQITGICFGGKSFDTLYVSTGQQIYARKMKISGIAPWMPMIKLPPWGAG
jgi:gluconolactonase